MQSGNDFAAAVVQAVEETDGHLSKTDAKHVTSVAQSQYKLGQTGLQGDALLAKMLEKMTPEQLLAYLGVKQGAKFDMLKNALDAYQQNRKELDDGTGIAGKIAAERQEGLGAALDRLSSSADSAEKNLVKLAASPIEGAVNAVTKLVNAFDSIPDGAKMGALTAGVLGVTAAATTSVAGIISLGASAASAAVSLNVLATRGIPGLPGGANPAANPGAAPATSAGTKVGTALGIVSKTLAWAAVADMVLTGLYAVTNDKATGFDREGSGEHTRAVATKEALKRDAEERMRRDIERSEQEAKDAADKGDANVESTQRRGSSGQMRRQLRDERPIDESEGLNTSAPVTATVTGTVSGEASITNTIIVSPSQWFTSKIGSIESAIVALQGSIGGDRKGLNMPGQNGAKPVFTGPQ